mgnify:CR=1 FL=1
MATTPKVLAQSNPSAASLTAVYTVAALTTAVINRIVAANRSTIATSIRVSVAIAGAADTLSQYVAYDTAIGGNECLPLPGCTLGPADVVRVYATLSTVSFNIFGVELT